MKNFSPLEKLICKVTIVFMIGLTIFALLNIVSNEKDNRPSQILTELDSLENIKNLQSMLSNNYPPDFFKEYEYTELTEENVRELLNAIHMPQDHINTYIKYIRIATNNFDDQSKEYNNPLGITNKQKYDLHCWKYGQNIVDEKGFFRKGKTAETLCTSDNWATLTYLSLSTSYLHFLNQSYVTTTLDDYFSYQGLFFTF